VLDFGPLSSDEECWVHDYGVEVRARKKLPLI